MRESKAIRTARFFNSMQRLGFTYEEAEQLRKIESTLHRWSEAECNGEIQREGEDGDGKPRRYYGSEMQHSYPIADKEAGALKRLAAIMSAHPELTAYHQTDPRGCALWILTAQQLGKHKVEEIYSRGFGVCFD